MYYINSRSDKKKLQTPLTSPGAVNWGENSKLISLPGLTAYSAYIIQALS